MPRNKDLVYHIQCNVVCNFADSGKKGRLKSSSKSDTIFNRIYTWRTLGFHFACKLGSEPFANYSGPQRNHPSIGAAAALPH